MSQTPAIPSPAGSASHRATSRVRAGSAASTVAAFRSKRRRLVRVSHTTSRRPVTRDDQPGSRAICGDRRALRSIPPSIACMSGVTDFTSMTTRTRRFEWNASTSVEPRSP